MRTLTLVILACISGFSGAQETKEQLDARATKFPFTRNHLREMVRLYKDYGLPMPPSGSRIIRIPRFFMQGKVVREQWEDGLAFLDPGSKTIYWGTLVLKEKDLKEKIYEYKGWQPVPFDDPWVAAPRRFIQGPDEGNSYTNLWAFLIHLAAVGKEDIALKMFPNWYTEFSVSIWGWRDCWATPERCVAEIASEYAAQIWRSGTGNRGEAERIMAKAIGYGFTFERSDYDPDLEVATQMRSALQHSSSYLHSAENAVRDLIEAERYTGVPDKCEALHRLKSLGVHAIPALLAHSEDVTQTRLTLEDSAIDPSKLRTPVGEICRYLLSKLPKAEVASAKVVWKSPGPAGELAYCKQHLFPLPDGRIAFPDPVMLEILSKRYPKTVYQMFELSLKTRLDIDPTPFLKSRALSRYSLHALTILLLDQASAKKVLGWEKGLRRREYEPIKVLATLVSQMEPSSSVTREVLNRADKLANGPLCVPLTGSTRALSGFKPRQFELANRLLKDKSKLDLGVYRNLDSMDQDLLLGEDATVANFAATHIGWMLDLLDPEQREKLKLGHWPEFMEIIQKHLPPP